MYTKQKRDPPPPHTNTIRRKTHKSTERYQMGQMVAIHTIEKKKIGSTRIKTAYNPFLSPFLNRPSPNQLMLGRQLTSFSSHNYCKFVYKEII